MPLSVFIEMTLSAILTVWSPGPNNILLLSTASKYGISGNLRFMAGIWSGSLTLMCLSGLFCSTLGKVIPGIQPVMKYLGAAYVLYLAWQTWRRLPPSDAVQEKKPTWLMGYFLQLVNVKIIIYGLTMFSAYILPYETKSSHAVWVCSVSDVSQGTGESDLGVCGKYAEAVLQWTLQADERGYGPFAGVVFPENCWIIIKKHLLKCSPISEGVFL